MINKFNAGKVSEAYKLKRIPRHWRENALEKYHDILKKEGGYAANDYIRALVEPLENLLNIAHDDDDIKKLAVELSKVCRNAFADSSNKSGGFWDRKRWIDWHAVVNELCIGYAVRYPHEFDANQQRARLSCELWWLRNLRNSHARAREVAAINAGLVHRKANLYCSDDTLERRGQQIKRNAALLDGVVMQSESGQQMKLGEIAAAGMANPDNRRAELMTRITGFEELANEYGHKAVFVTVTCPSRMHAVTANGKPNPKYDGTKPDEAQKYLVECWARARAKLARYEVKFYGLRVAEPHHDATPHWHMILFYKPRDTGDMVRIITQYFLADSATEAGAKENRVKFVHINPMKGTAAGYVVKYVCKNLGGLDDEMADEGNITSKSAAGRVEAWATTWRIRQFQQLGGHSVTVWRELRRVAVEVAIDVGRQIFKGWQACQKQVDEKASYAKFIHAMGGLERSPKNSLIQIDDDYVNRTGRYGATVTRMIKGVRERFGIERAENNREAWHRV
ncbi:MAG: hypothetical protein BVN34_09130 [Proteobacteria bacterium ST_bin12]|nr:MAG: hypothetical protein BVN34_09130 [Proteobacteria bacterium ST_bin12]